MKNYSKITPQARCQIDGLHLRGEQSRPTLRWIRFIARLRSGFAHPRDPLTSFLSRPPTATLLAGVYPRRSRTISTITGTQCQSFATSSSRSTSLRTQLGFVRSRNTSTAATQRGLTFHRKNAFRARWKAQSMHRALSVPLVCLCLASPRASLPSTPPSPRSHATCLPVTYRSWCSYLSNLAGVSPCWVRSAVVGSDYLTDRTIIGVLLPKPPVPRYLDAYDPCPEGTTAPSSLPSAAAYTAWQEREKTGSECARARSSSASDVALGWIEDPRHRGSGGGETKRIGAGTSLARSLDLPVLHFSCCLTPPPHALDESASHPRSSRPLPSAPIDHPPFISPRSLFFACFPYTSRPNDQFHVRDRLNSCALDGVVIAPRPGLDLPCIAHQAGGGDYRVQTVGDYDDTYRPLDEYKHDSNSTSSYSC
ncbi:hypothetical protein MSAN_02448500 [Mycena sanguinolenta]|uniref:Uncharacterized protein n=1 Tax=Mycena sanguinolenta TaxID=230812 RepID=A0A8H6WY02_9AGAR|nr:hypothetical protein MSAN_02448500 [Mycena sanguinolenta]